MSFFLSKRHRVDLLWQLIKTNFKMRYQNSILGVLWVVIKPYTTFIVMYIIWSNFGGQVVPNYVLYLMVGVIFYTYFNEMIIFGQLALLDRAGIILKVNFPRQIVVVSALFSALINLCINMILVVVIMLLRGHSITFLGTLYFLVLTLLVFTFSLGVSFFLSVITVRFRDLKNVFELGLFILMWASPVFYTVAAPKFDNSVFIQIVKNNPIGVVLNQVRAAFDIYGEVNLSIIFWYFIFSLLLVFVGWVYFNRNVKKIAEYF